MNRVVEILLTALSCAGFVWVVASALIDGSF